MKSPNPIYIQDVFSEIVAKVNTEMLPALEALNLAKGYNLTGVHYQYGTGLEIIETLSQMSQNDSEMDKYPLICLFLDVNETFGTEAGVYSEIPTLRMAIINSTDMNFKAYQRDDENFKPILTPIYQCLLRRMHTEGAFMFNGLGFEHDAKRNYFWGREGLYGKEGSIFNDRLDAIEITFRNLKIYSSYCTTVQY